MKKQYSFIFEEKLIVPVLVTIATRFEIKLISVAKFQQPAKFHANRTKDS